MSKLGQRLIKSAKEGRAIMRSLEEYEPMFGDGREEDWFAWLCKEKEEMAKGKSGKVEKVMHEWKHGTLHSGSKKGPVVKSRRQAVAIALSEARRGKK